ncbi:hypothetical protein, partial [Sinorhizobium sp. CCBAU 05631]|uniref:hypothetical protein n=1 Tax=Sinorhizobium sp. CCBAU 05631 TaxID=794846 RepID=UPI00056127AF
MKAEFVVRIMAPPHAGARRSLFTAAAARLFCLMKPDVEKGGRKHMCDACVIESVKQQMLSRR